MKTSTKCTCCHARNSVLAVLFIMVFLIRPAIAGEPEPHLPAPYPPFVMLDHYMGHHCANIMTFSLTDSIILVQYLKQAVLQASTVGLGTPYAPSPLGEGRMGAIDRDPLYRFDCVDCMTWVEQTLALGVSTPENPFEDVLLDIRYHSIVPHFETRNHFLIADWLPDNAWLLQDVTVMIGDSLCRPMSKFIDRQRLFRDHGYRPKTPIPKQKLTVRYIPKEHLLALQDKFQSVDIACLVTHKQGLFVSHLGFLIHDADNGLMFRNASIWSRKVIDQPFSVLVGRLMKKPHMAGMIVLRIRVR